MLSCLLRIYKCIDLFTPKDVVRKKYTQTKYLQIQIETYKTTKLYNKTVIATTSISLAHQFFKPQLGKIKNKKK